MTLRRAVVAGTLALLAAVALCAAAAKAEESYSVDGRDVFVVGNGDVHDQTSYRGVQRLAIQRSPQGTTYKVHVSYDKDGDSGKVHETASYTSTLLHSGELRDGPSHDPDYLTVLNQPFAVQLDAPTMRDLARVTRPVPFDFPSPMTGAPLQGTLRRLPDAIVAGTRSMGIAFEATGPLQGPLPDRPAMALVGSIRMKGTAYYAYDTALLVALNATLAIDGALAGSAQHVPVSIVYARSIRSLRGAPVAHASP
jgi:hypothetical protein